ncbi:type I-D CRISPR-associated protein Csc1 [Sulfolobus tengchongensis]|uniref:Type I-D CRISPR-associated protein Csc1 n=1 Tax=Sulfolobus tengchongensis TaxID=207809 RepID=A0AAX4L1M1_9CREN
MIYKVTLKVEGILIFSSEVRPAIIQGDPLGSYITPLPYIHNYPLIYGIIGKSSEAYFVIPSMHLANYTERGGETELNYTSVKAVIEEAKKGKGFYIYPAIPKKIITSSFLMSSESWTYWLLRGKTKNVFPRLTSYTAFMPESEFVTYMVSKKGFIPPEWIRIGKKRWGIMRVEVEEVKLQKKEKKSDCLTSIPVNFKDTTEFGYEVKSFSKVLETPSSEEGLIGWVTLEECWNVVGKVNQETVNLELPFPNESFISED